ncbi:unnamed protein product, partial [Musa acuminata subsp. malaccensis]
IGCVQVTLATLLLKGYMEATNKGFYYNGTLQALIYERCWVQVAQDFNSISLIGEILFTKGQQHLFDRQRGCKNAIVSGAAPEPDGGFDGSSRVEVIGGRS